MWPRCWRSAPGEADPAPPSRNGRGEGAGPRYAANGAAAPSGSGTAKALMVIDMNP